MKIQCLLILLCLQLHLFAQQPAVNFHKAYQAQTRNMDGTPGLHYWQNGGRYKIAVHFDPLTREVSGQEGIDYINNSPDTLQQIVFKLYPNLYQAQAMRNTVVSPEDLTKGMIIKHITLNGKEKKSAIRGTNMYMKNVKVFPGQQVHLDIVFNYTLNKTSFIRTGQVDSGAFVIAYFFPRIAVYDDIDGWNEYPYVGKEEFYNDYCDFDMLMAVMNRSTCLLPAGRIINEALLYH